MYPAIITASKLATLAQWPSGTTEAIVTFDYCDGPVGYTAKVKVNRNRGEDSPRVVCGYCMTAAQCLYKHPTRIGLCCASCRTKANERADRAETRADAANKKVKAIA